MTRLMTRRNQKLTTHTCDEYLIELKRQLCRHVPHERAAQIVEEAQAHLLDRVEELTSKGVARAEAEAVAIAGFGSVRTYARAAAVSAYGDRRAARWRLVGRIACVVFVTFLVQAPLLRVESVFPAPYYFALAAGVLCCPFIVWAAAFRSRLPQTGALSAQVACALAAVFFGAGLIYVPNADTPPILFARLNSPTETEHGGPGLRRGSHASRVAAKRQEQAFSRQEAALLAIGTRVYGSGGAVPSALMHDNQYIVPRDAEAAWCYDRSGGALDTSAFKESLYTDMLAYEQAQINALAPQTVPTYAVAQKAWAERGPVWIAGKHTYFAHQEREIATLQRATAAPLGFNTGAATYHTSFLLWLCVPLVLVDLLFAHLGRALWSFRRSRRRSRRA